VEFIQQKMPGVVPTCPEATYLLLMDCANAGIEDDPCHLFLEKGRVALSGNFGTQGPEFDKLSRLNFGCPRAQLTGALERMRQALA
jgi:bifunctional pyridoxal-dependent enzyme with beta-cystathionase and maltose regulon repressor activities